MASQSRGVGHVQEFLMVSGFGENDSNGQQTESGGNDLGELVRTLGNAYANAITHGAAHADSEDTDLQLEAASIRLSSRIVSEFTTEACRPADRGTGRAVAGGECTFEDEAVSLRGLTDMLSYAAARLQGIGASSGPRISPLEVARIRSMEHLYRMTFAVSSAYLDRSQSGIYLVAAREELKFARKHIQLERDLCHCSPRGYTARLLELSDLDERLKQVPAA
jgi:hypothetical protein